MEPFKRHSLDRQVVCAQCGSYRWHDVVAYFETSTTDESNEISWYEEWRTLACRGCGYVSFEHSSLCTEDYDLDGNSEWHRQVFPKTLHVRKPLYDYTQLPYLVAQMYLETISAYNERLRVLAAVGVRAVLEAVCKDQNCGGDDLRGRIDALVPLGALSRMQADFLHELRFMGNAAAHEIVAPDSAEMSTAIDIAENLLRNLYELPRLAEQLRKRRLDRRTSEGQVQTGPR